MEVFIASVMRKISFTLTWGILLTNATLILSLHDVLQALPVLVHIVTKHEKDHPS